MAVERTFVMIKPDGVMRNLAGKVIGRFEQAGFKIVGLRMAKPTKEQVEGFYPSSDDWFGKIGEKTKHRYNQLGIDGKAVFGTNNNITIGKMVKKWLISYISSSPVVLMVLEGNNAAEKTRKMVGNTDPINADTGTIRGDFTLESVDWANSDKRAVMNIVHASGDSAEAKEEIAYWFKPAELFDYENAFDIIINKLGDA
ncbi:MAG: nucleoside-diphosphate kinase [Candidatus Altiarchaeota archaeon]|nr:nucleoside-diphosphate kinase [Candidatus Altiarchaeota archaeon]